MADVWRCYRRENPGYHEIVRSPLWVSRVGGDARTVLVDVRPQALPSLAAVDGRERYLQAGDIHQAGPASHSLVSSRLKVCADARTAGKAATYAAVGP